MKSQMNFQAENLLISRRRRGHLKRGVALMSAFVMLFTMNSLKQDADTLERLPMCGLEEHTHTLACYPLYCGQEESEPIYDTQRVYIGGFDVHQHTADCYDDDGVLACGYIEGEYWHTHNRFCYDDNGDLVCGLKERKPHEHTEDCYGDVATLACGLEEFPAHFHTEDCYTERKVLTCGLEESAGHKHTEDCYAEYDQLTCEKEESAGHKHTEDCYTVHEELTCDKAESEGHVHTDDCYVEFVEQVCDKVESDGHHHTEDCYRLELTCGEIEGEDHVHTEDCYSLVLVCGLEEGEGAHEHTEECFAVTRELGCGLEEGEGAHKHTEDCYTTFKDLTCGLKKGEGAHTHTEKCYTHVKELVCGMEKGEGAHSHTDDCYTTIPELTCELEETEGHTHTEECYSHSLELVCGKDEGERLAEKLGVAELHVHYHSDDCFTTVTRVVNGEERKLRFATCGCLEVQNFVSGESDWADVPVLLSEGHRHTEDCYDLSAAPICGLEEHTHSDACFQERPTAPAYVAGSESVDLGGSVVSLSWGEDAELTEDAHVTVSEVVRGTSEYDALYSRALDVLPPSGEAVTRAMRFFDIGIYNKEERRTFAAPVSVDIRVDRGEMSAISAVRFDGSDAILLDAANGDGVTFDTDALGLYGVAFDVPAATVDRSLSVSVDLSSVDLMDAATVNADSVTLSVSDLIDGADDSVDVEGRLNVDSAEFLRSAEVTSADVQFDGDMITLPADALESGSVSLQMQTEKVSKDYVTTVTTQTVDIELSGYAGRTDGIEQDNISVTALGDNSLPADAKATVEENLAVPAGIVGEGEAAAAFDITITNDNGDVISDTGAVTVTVNPTDLNVLADLPEGATPTGITYQLFHIHEDGEPRLIPLGRDAVVLDDQGNVQSLTFETNGFSTYVLKYTVDFEYLDNNLIVRLDFADITANGVDFDRDDVLSALNDGVSVDLEALLNGAQSQDVDTDLRVSIAREGGARQEFIGFDRTVAALVSADERVEYANGQMKVTGDGVVVLSQGSDTITVIVTGYSRLLADAVSGEGVSIDVVKGQVPAGSKATYAPLSDYRTAELVNDYITEESQENVEYTAFDVSIAMPEGDEFKSVGEYNVTVEHEVALPENVDADHVHYTLYHIHDGQVEVLPVNVEDGRIMFTTESFSDFVLSYTVDFEYNGYTYKLRGGSVIGLAELLNILHIDITNEEIEYATFSNEDVVKVYQLNEDKQFGTAVFAADTWILRSDIPFTSHEKLVVKASDGKVYNINVTDETTPCDLTALTSQIDATVSQTGKVDRDATLNINFSFKITGDKITTAKNNDCWVYDLSDKMGDVDDVFKSIANEANGILIDGDNVAGRYVVEDGKVYIYPDLEYLKKYNESLSGSFTLVATLNEKHNPNETEETFTFPGGASVTVEYEEKKLSHSKKVGAGENNMGNAASSNTTNEVKDGSTITTPKTTTTDYGDVQVVENEDGTYTLYYQIDVSPNQAFQQFTISDTLSAGQTLNADSIKVYANGELLSSNTYAYTAGHAATQGSNSFELDLVKTLTNADKALTAWTSYRVAYTATVTKEQLASLAADGKLTNTADYKWDGHWEEDVTKEHPKFTEEVSHNKLTGVNPDSIYSTGGNVNLVKDETTQKYYLYWNVKVNPNTSLTSLKLEDTISNGLTFVNDSFKLYINGQESNIALNPTINGKTFTIDNLAALLDGGKTKPNTEYSIRYATEVDASYVENKTAVSNSASWNWNGTPETDTVTVTPQKPDPSYPIEKKASLGSAKPGDTITYTITLPAKDGNGATVDRAGHTIRDYISSVIEPGEITNLKVETLGGTDVTNQMTIAYGTQPENHDGTYEVFTVTFPSGTAYTDGYIISYTVTVPDDPDRIGRLYLTNAGWDGNNSHGDSTTTVDYGTPEIEKKFQSWDDENNKMVWQLNVKVPDGKTLNDVYVQERDFSGSTYQYYLGDPHTVDWDNVVVTYDNAAKTALTKAGSSDNLAAGQYYVDTENNRIYFGPLSQSVVITLATESPVPFNSGEEYFTQNTAELWVGDKNVDSATDRARHTKSDYTFTKSGTIEPGTGITTWEVHLNQTNNIINPDIIPYFEDTIPEGMKLYGDSISITVYGNNNTNRYGQQIGQITNGDYKVDASDGEIGLINLVDAVNYKLQWNQEGNSPTGLSGMHYYITYKTELTDEMKAKVESEVGLYSFTNKADVTDAGGKVLKTTGDTVEYEYKNLIQKYDMTDTNAAGHIDYRIIVNPEGLELNGGAGHFIELTDVISTDVSLLTNTVKVYSTAPEDGDTIMEGVTVGYNDNSRIMQVFIPDGRYARVEYSVKPNRTGITFTNKAVLKGGRIVVSDEVEKHHNVTSGGTLTGTENSIKLYKFDQYNLTRGLQGAEFELYRCTVNENGTITNREKVATSEDPTNYTFVTDQNGEVKFPIGQQTTLYYWVETKAPTVDEDEFMLLDTNPHYFVTYKQYDVNTIKTNYPGHPEIELERVPGEVINELAATYPEMYWYNNNQTQPKVYSVEPYPKPSGDYVVLTASQLSKTVAYINTVVQKAAWDLDDKVEAANGIKVASLLDGYTWRYGNVKKTAKAQLEGVKQMLGREMAAGEFNFNLYDNTDPNDPVWMETAKNIQGANGQYTQFKFNEIAYVMPGTYRYLISEAPGGTRDPEVVYDASKYEVVVEVERVAAQDSVEEDEVVNGLRVKSITYYKNGEKVVLPQDTQIKQTDDSILTVPQGGKNTALFVNKKDEANLTITKSFSGDYFEGKTEEQIAEIKEGVTFQVWEGETMIKEFTYAQMLAGEMTLTASDNIQSGHTYTVKEVMTDITDVTVLTTYELNSNPGEGADVTVEMAEKAVKLDYNNDYTQDKTSIRVLKRWYYNTPGANSGDPDILYSLPTPANVSQVYFWLQKRVDNAEGQPMDGEGLLTYEYQDGVSGDRKAYEVGWEYYKSRSNIYSIKASKNWSANFDDLPKGTYRIVEIEKRPQQEDTAVNINGTWWRPVNCGDSFYSVGVKELSQLTQTSVPGHDDNKDPVKIDVHVGTGTEDGEDGHELVVYDKIVRIEFTKQWKDKENKASNMSDLGIEEVVLELQSNTADSETGWTSTGKTQTITKNGSQTVEFFVTQKDPNTGAGLYYRVVEKSMTLTDGTVLNESQIKERFDISFTPVTGRYVAEHNHMYPADGFSFNQDNSVGDQKGVNGRIQTFTNTEKDFGIELTKVFVEPDGGTTTKDTIYFKLMVQPEGSSSWVAVTGTDVKAINKATKEVVSPNANGIYTLAKSGDTWPTLRFEYILRNKTANGTIPSQAVYSYLGAIEKIKFVETDASGKEFTANPEYIVAYSYSGTEGDSTGVSPYGTGTYTITNTRREPTELNVTKQFLNNKGREVAQNGDKIYFKVVLKGKDESGYYDKEAWLPDAAMNSEKGIAVDWEKKDNGKYYIEYTEGSGWDTAHFKFDSSIGFNGGAQLLNGIYVIECESNGNAGGAVYNSEGTPYTLSGYVTEYDLAENGAKVIRDISATNMIPASTNGTLTIINLPEDATVTPEITKKWLYGADTEPKGDWPGKVVSITAQLYRKYADPKNGTTEYKVDDPVTLTASTVFPYAFHRQYKYDDDGKEWTYFVKEEKIRLLDGGEVVDIDLTSTNPYIDNGLSGTAADGVLTTLTNHTDDEEYTKVRVTKKWKNSDGTDKKWDEGHTITFTLKQGDATVDLDQEDVANGVLNRDGTITITGTAAGWPVAEITLPKYVDGKVASYYVVEDGYNDAHPATSESGYYEISYQLNGQNKDSDKAAATNNGTITIVNKDIEKGDIKVTKKWFDQDDQDINGYIKETQIQFRLYYRYKKWTKGQDESTSTNYDDGGTIGDFTIHRLEDGSWETVTLPKLSDNPDGKTSESEDYKAVYYIVELDSTGVERAHEPEHANASFTTSDGKKNFAVSITDAGYRRIFAVNSNGYFTADENDLTVQITNRYKTESNRVDIFKKWMLYGEDVTSTMPDDVSATVELWKKTNDGENRAIVETFTLNKSNGWHVSYYTGNAFTEPYTAANTQFYIVETGANGMDSGDITTTYTANGTQYVLNDTNKMETSYEGANSGGVIRAINVLPTSTTMHAEKSWKDVKGTSMAWPTGAEVTVELRKQRGDEEPVALTAAEQEAVETTSGKAYQVVLDGDHRSVDWNPLNALTGGYKYVVVETSIVINGIPAAAEDFDTTVDDTEYGKSRVITNQVGEKTRLTIQKVFESNVGDEWLTDEMKQRISFTIADAEDNETTFVYGQPAEAANDGLGIRDSASWETDPSGELTGKLILRNLDPGKYTVTETDTIPTSAGFPEGLVRKATVQVNDGKVLESNTASVYLNSGDAGKVTITITNSYDGKSIDIPVDKKWLNGEFNDLGDNWPAGVDPVTVKLYESVDGGVATDTGKSVVLKSGHMSDVFQNLSEQKYVGGEYKPVTYSLREEPSTNLLSITGSAAEGFTVTNITEPGLYVTKKWTASDGETEITSTRNKVYFKVGSKYSWDSGFTYGNIKEIAKKLDGTWSIVKLDSSDLNDVNKTYCIKEVNEDGSDVTDFDVTYILDGEAVPSTGVDNTTVGLLTIKNSNQEKKGEIEVVKKWVGGEPRPIQVELRRVAKTGSDYTTPDPDKTKVEFYFKEDNVDVLKETRYYDSGTKLTIQYTRTTPHNWPYIWWQTWNDGQNQYAYISGANLEENYEITVPANNSRYYLSNNGTSYVYSDFIIVDGSDSTSQEEEIDKTTSEAVPTNGTSDPETLSIENPVTLDSSNGWYHKWENLASGYVYFIEELSVPGYRPEYSNNDGITKGLITITNTKIQMGRISVKKKDVVDESTSKSIVVDDSKTFTFQILNGATVVDTLEVKKGETATSVELPLDVTYTIQESAQATIDNYTFHEVQFDNASVKLDSAHKLVTVEATNYYTPNPVQLNITKAVAAGSTATANDVFTVKVTLRDSANQLLTDAVTVSGSTVNSENGSKTPVNGVVTVQLKANDTVTIGGLPAGVKYAVSEEASNGWKLVSISPTAGSILIGQTGSVTVTNEKDLVDIDATKTWHNADVGDITAELKNASITFRLEKKVGDGEWTTVESKTISTTDTPKSAAEWTASWSGLAKYEWVGQVQSPVQYRVTESAAKVNTSDDALMPGTKTTTFADSDFVQKSGHTNKTATADFINTLPEVEVGVTKAWARGQDTSWPTYIASVKVALYQKYGEMDAAQAVSGKVLTLTAPNPSDSWDNLPLYTDAGEKITYSVVETAYVPTDTNTETPAQGGSIGDFAITYGEITTYSNGAAQVTVTNSKDVPPVQITASKVWKQVEANGNVRDMTAAEKASLGVTYQVWRKAYTDEAKTALYNGTGAPEQYANGTGFTGALNADNGWTETVSELPSQGTITTGEAPNTTSTVVYYDYYVVEVAGTNYPAAEAVRNGNAFTFTNKLTEFEATKVWSGLTNDATFRAAQATFTLTRVKRYTDGTPDAADDWSDTKILTYADHQAADVANSIAEDPFTWKAKWSGLAYEGYDAVAGKPFTYVYSVAEASYKYDCDSAVTITDGKDLTGRFSVTQNGATITNARELTEITIVKKWSRDNAPATDDMPSGEAAVHVKVHLYRQNGEQVEIDSTTGKPVASGATAVPYEVPRVKKADSDEYEWKLVISNLEKYYYDDSRNRHEYAYFISEVAEDMNGWYAIRYENEHGNNDTTGGSANVSTNSGTLTVTNSKYTVSLPSTGGMGTSWFYVAGASLMLLAVLGFVLSSRKRCQGDGID